MQGLPFCKNSCMYISPCLARPISSSPITNMCRGPFTLTNHSRHVGLTTDQSQPRYTPVCLPSVYRVCWYVVYNTYSLFKSPTIIIYSLNSYHALTCFRPPFHLLFCYRQWGGIGEKQEDKIKKGWLFV